MQSSSFPDLDSSFGTGAANSIMCNDDRWQQLADALGIADLDIDLLEQALSHASYVRENGGAAYESNQRMEFLGDAVLDAIIAGELYQRFPQADEGWLTRAKSAVVQTANLANVARKLGLGPYLRLGQSEENTGGRHKTSVLADSLEALLGAIYLSSGYQRTRQFVIAHFLSIIDDVEDESFRDAKTTLQELCQSLTHVVPEYVVTRRTGPDHDPVFDVEVRLSGRVLGTGRGGSKQRAEQAAARDALASQDEWTDELSAAPNGGE